MTLQWKDEYSVGVEALDFDHKLLFSLINQLDSAILDKQEAEIIDNVLGVLAEYTRYHFIREEKLMTKGGYPRLDEHHGRHETLTERVNDLRARFAANDPHAAEAVRDFLAEWLTKHILTEDQAYRGHVQGLRLTDQEETEILENASAEDQAYSIG